MRARTGWTEGRAWGAAWGLLAAALVGLSCAHAERVQHDHSSPGDERAGGAAREGRGVGGSGETKAAPEQAAPPERRARHREAGAAPSDEASEPPSAGAQGSTKARPPLASTPEGLRKPGGEEKVAQALREKGFLKEAGGADGEVDPAQLSGAIRRFQESRDLAATGFADDETLVELGLNPNDVNKSQKRRPHRRHWF